MKVSSLLTGVFAVLAGAASAFAAVTHVYEYSDRYMVEIDGSMDQKAAPDAGCPSARQVPPSSAASPAAALNTPARATDDASAPPEQGKQTSKPYDRAEQVKAFMSQMPARSQAIADRLEGRQARWSTLRSSVAAQPK